MSVVAALSRWLIHTNRRHNGAWTQRYEFGIPCSDLVSLPPTTETGTTIQFLVDQQILLTPLPDAERLREVADFRWLCIEFLTEQDLYRASGPADVVPRSYPKNCLPASHP